MTFKNEKHCREGTIGRAMDIAKFAASERRIFTDDEAARVDAFLLTAETVLGLSPLPRDAAGLMILSNQPKQKRVTR